MGADFLQLAGQQPTCIRCSDVERAELGHHLGTGGVGSDYPRTPGNRCAPHPIDILTLVEAHHVYDGSAGTQERSAQRRQSRQDRRCPADRARPTIDEIGLGIDDQQR